MTSKIALVAKLALVLTLIPSTAFMPSAAWAEVDTPPCLTEKDLIPATGQPLVASDLSKAKILIVTAEPKSRRPLHVQVTGLMPFEALPVRRVEWDFHNLASLFNRSWGPAATAIYLSPGAKTITLRIVDLGGKTFETSCRLTIG